MAAAAKVSEQAIKTLNPGILQVRRFFEQGEAAADVIYDEDHPIQGDCVLVDPLDPTREKSIPGGRALSAGWSCEDLLVPIFRGGKRVYDPPPLEETRRRVQEQLAAFHPGVKRLVNPH